MQTVSFNPPINLVEESKWLLAVSSFETTKSVFIVTIKNNSFAFSIPGHWISEGDDELNNKLNN